MGKLTVFIFCLLVVSPVVAERRAGSLPVCHPYRSNLSRKFRHFVDFNLPIDNLFNKRYFPTQNYFESRLRPDGVSAERLHATPGYPPGRDIWSDLQTLREVSLQDVRH